MLSKRRLCQMAICVALLFMFLTFFSGLLAAGKPLVYAMLTVFGVSTFLVAVGDLRGWDK